jgi:hypothetical protein
MTVKLIGYWAPAPHWSWARSYFDQQPPWPDVRRAVHVGWRVPDREQLLTYLRSGHYLWGFLGSSSCRFECRANDHLEGLGSAELTDGEWVWPHGLAHYVERHAVILPEDFVTSASGRGWRVPPKDQIPERRETKVDHSFWLDWGNRLPGVPEKQSFPDPQVFEAFRLIVRFPGIRDSDEQIEAFEDEVWEKLENEYGRWVCGQVAEVGYERHLEWVSVKQRDFVLRLVLDGLSCHGLAERAMVICSEPDPHDWQRDRNLTVWPPGEPR